MLLAAPLPFDRTGALPRIMDIKCVAEKSFTVDFTTQNGRFYFLQYSDDLKQWTTEPQAMKGTGNMFIAPQIGEEPKRFYRVLMVP
jgi:hypothetical protein